MVAERKARGGGTCRATQDLVAEADAEHRYATERLASQLHRPIENGRVAWPVGQDEPVRACRLDVRPLGGVREHDDPAAALLQRAEDVALHTVVDDRDRKAGAISLRPGSQLTGQRVEPLDHRGSRCLRHEVLVRKRCHSGRGRRQLRESRLARRTVLVRKDRPHRSVIAQVTSQRSSVDLPDGGNAPSAQIFVERGFARVMARRRTCPADDHRPRPRSLRLGVSLTHAVVPLEWIGHAQHLARVRRIGQHLLVTGHRGVEDDLALPGHVRAQSKPHEGPPVLEHQGRVLSPGAVRVPFS